MQQVLQDFEVDEELEYMKAYHSLYFDKVSASIGSEKSASHRFLFISDFNVALFTKKFFSNKLRLEFNSRWTEIQEVRYVENDKDGFLAFRAKPISTRITSKNRAEIAALVMKFGKSIFSMQDAPTPSLHYPKDYEMPEFTKSIPVHLKYELFQKGIQLPNRQIASLAKFFSGNPTEFKLDQFYWLIQYIPNVIKIIQWAPSITKLIIPLDTVPDGATHVQKIMKFNKSIRELSFSNGTISNLKEIFTAIVSNHNSKLTGVHFTGVTFTLNDIYALDDFVRSYKIENLTLDLALDHSLSLNFTEDSLKIENFSYLQTLILDNTPGLNLNRIFFKMKELKLLSVVNCGIEVNQLIKLFQNIKGNILKINASYNKCTVPIKYKPKKLIKTNTHSIDLSNINWSEKDFVEVWKFFAANPDISLNLSSATLSDGSWETLMKQLIGVESQITELYWNDNISTDIINLAKKCPNLTSLSLARIFSENDPEISNLSKYIRKTRTLKKLNISGSRRKFIGKDLPTIFDAISDNESITNLDIRKNHAGESFPTDLIGAFQKNSTVEILAIDGNDIIDPEKYKQIFEQLLSREKPLFIVWPQKEINTILVSSGNDQGDYENLIDLHQRLAHIGEN